MLRLNNISLYRGGHPLFKAVNLMASDGQHIGVVGNNGSGKTSFLSMIQKELLPEEGSLKYPADWKISYVTQVIDDFDVSAIDYVLNGDIQFRQAEKALLQAQASGNASEIADAHEKMHQADGYSAQARAARLLNGLGIDSCDVEKKVGEFSGGWQMRLHLARALIGRSNLLLLDEPTNHLDLDAIAWLERWLSSYPGVLLVVSHDRDFLDRAANRIWHIEGQQIHVYAGNYSAFEKLRAEKLAQVESQAKRHAAQVIHMEQFINRFRAKATKAKQVQSRIKALERLKTVSMITDDVDYQIEFLTPEKQADPLLTLKQVSAGYPDHTVLQGVSFEVRASERIAILGRNGAGKSTFIRSIAGLLPILAGTITKSPYLKIGYLAQHQLESFHPEDTAISYMLRENPQMTDQEIRNFLGKFGFGGRFSQQVACFSGGEKTRLALAAIIWQKPNLLLLDEPTNHLDLSMRDAIILALQSYEGAMILVSHDRHLIRHCADQLYLIHQGRFSLFDDDLDAYQKLLQAKEAGEKTEGTGYSRKDQKREEARLRQTLSQQRKPIEKEIQKIENQIDRLSVEKQALEVQLSSPEVYDAKDKTHLQSLIVRQAEINQELLRLEDRWLDCQNQWEALSSS